MDLQMLTDLYEFSMANGYYATLPHDRQARFDVFYRRVPDNGSFVIAAGLQQVVEQVANWHFSKENIEYLKSLKEFSPDFLDYLSKIKNSCTIQALPEGTPVFPREPIISISGPLIEAQLLETFVLNIINHQSLIATKSWQINHAAQGRPIMEFGARRAQGPDAATYGARAAVIGGCTSTSNLQAASQFHIPAAGTMAHAWVESFPDELSAFQAWAKVYPNKISLLVDTYDVLKSGVPNAIRVFKQARANGHEPVSIRIDSGDISQLAIKARQMLDEAGFPQAKITASNALDAHVVKSLLDEGAPIDNFGIGERLITSSSSPVLSGVYKLAEESVNGKWIPTIKVSDSREKVTIPGNKQVYRIYSNDQPNKAIADVIALADESITTPLKVVNSDPTATNASQILTNFTAKPLLKTYLTAGQPAKVETDVFKIQQTSRQLRAQLPEASKRLVNPDRYPVYLTTKLADLQEQLITKAQFAEEN